jgi:uncharacterized YccA/Bax inhibitor family protein
MSNPVFENSPYFGEPKKGSAAAGTATAASTAYTLNGQQVEQLEQAYASPAAAAVHTGRMTYDDVIIKTGGLLVLVVGMGAVAWFMFPGNALVMTVGVIGGLVLGLVNAFRREPSPAMIVGYAAFEGLFLGAISSLFEARYGGIVLQAVLATFATFAATLLLFTSGRVRVTPRSTRIVMVAMLGYLLFSLVNVGIMMFGNSGSAWGLRDSVTVMGIPLGIIIGFGAVALAAYCLIMDFDSIKRGVERGVPARFAWSAAFGLIVTLVWLYLEFLRLLAIFRN